MNPYRHIQMKIYFELENQLFFLNTALGVSVGRNERCLVTAEFTCMFAGFLLTAAG